MSIELDILRDVSDRLDHAGIPFMVTGSMAMNAYAQPRMTRDIDIVIEVKAIDAARLLAAFRSDYYIDDGAVDRAIRNESLFNVIHQEWVFKVDLIVRKHTPYRALEFERRQRLQIGDYHTWVVSKEDLILSKLCWGLDSQSEYQARDIRNLLNTTCDRDYIQEWAVNLGVMDYLRSIEK
ncbi:MAG TPA: hypothetical protein VGM54_17035 [Chthoniobacter sp.]